jgi:hypothetical protein
MTEMITRRKHHTWWKMIVTVLYRTAKTGIAAECG